MDLKIKAKVHISKPYFFFFLSCPPLFFFKEKNNTQHVWYSKLWLPHVTRKVGNKLQRVKKNTFQPFVLKKKTKKHPNNLKKLIFGIKSTFN
jgi:hypothetical protein